MRRRPSGRQVRARTVPARSLAFSSFPKLPGLPWLPQAPDFPQLPQSARARSAGSSLFPPLVDTLSGDAVASAADHSPPPAGPERVA
jgi:hypothetical protein